MSWFICSITDRVFCRKPWRAELTTNLTAIVLCRAQRVCSDSADPQMVNQRRQRCKLRRSNCNKECKACLRKSRTSVSVSSLLKVVFDAANRCWSNIFESVRYRGAPALPLTTCGSSYQLCWQAALWNSPCSWVTKSRPGLTAIAGNHHHVKATKKVTLHRKLWLHCASWHANWSAAAVSAVPIHAPAEML